MKIKVNDYVRTKEGYICKILKLNEPRYDDGYLDFNDIDSPRIYKPNVVKSSPNIGKLLKVGDFIDGMRIIEIEDTTIHTLGGWFIDVDDVEDLVTSIVTKEQFEQMEYKIESEVN